MKHTVMIAIALCLALGLFVGWNFYRNTDVTSRSILISNTYV